MRHQGQGENPEGSSGDSTQPTQQLAGRSTQWPQERHGEATSKHTTRTSGLESKRRRQTERRGNNKKRESLSMPPRPATTRLNIARRLPRSSGESGQASREGEEARTGCPNINTAAHTTAQGTLMLPVALLGVLLQLESLHRSGKGIGPASADREVQPSILRRWHVSHQVGPACKALRTREPNLFAASCPGEYRRGSSPAHSTTGDALLFRHPARLNEQPPSMPNSEHSGRPSVEDLETQRNMPPHAKPMSRGASRRTSHHWMPCHSSHACIRRAFHGRGDGLRQKLRSP